MGQQSGNKHKWGTFIRPMFFLFFALATIALIIIDTEYIIPRKEHST
jgi:hypothetical protein